MDRSDIIRNSDYGPLTPFIVMGDLQNDLGRKAPKLSLLRHLINSNGPNVKSVGYETKGNGPYITRTDEKGNKSGIDHALACPLAQNMSFNFYIDDFICQQFGGSDHSLIAMSVDFGFQHKRRTQAVEVAFLYKEISKLPLETAVEIDSETKEKRYTYRLKDAIADTRESTKREELYKELQEKFDPSNEGTAESLNEIEALLSDLKSNIIQNAIEQGATDRNGSIVNQTKEHREQLDEITAKFFRVLERCMTEAGLSSKRKEGTSDGQLKRLLLDEDEDTNEDLPPHIGLKQVKKKIQTLSKRVGYAKRILR